MNAAFADTFLYLALLNDSDPGHERALADLKVPRPIVTTEFSVLELGNACQHFEQAGFKALLR